MPLLYIPSCKQWKPNNSKYKLSQSFCFNDLCCSINSENLRWKRWPLCSWVATQVGTTHLRGGIRASHAHKYFSRVTWFLLSPRIRSYSTIPTNIKCINQLCAELEHTCKYPVFRDHSDAGVNRPDCHSTDIKPWHSCCCCCCSRYWSACTFVQFGTQLKSQTIP